MEFNFDISHIMRLGAIYVRIAATEMEFNLDIFHRNPSTKFAALATMYATYVFPTHSWFHILSCNNDGHVQHTHEFEERDHGHGHVNMPHRRRTAQWAGGGVASGGSASSVSGGVYISSSMSDARIPSSTPSGRAPGRD